MNDHHNDDHEQDDYTEEDIRDMIEDSKQYNYMSIGYDIGFVLHKGFGMHTLLTLIVNLLSASIIIGLTSRFSSLIEVTLVGFFIGMLLYTLIELVVKIILIRWLLRPIIWSLGLIFYILNVFIFWLSDQMVEHFDFKLRVENIFIFTFLFMFLRTIFSTYIRKAEWIQKGRK